MKKSILLILVVVGLAIATYYISVVNAPPRIIIPVKNATKHSYDQKSFGAPRVGHRHRGVDIFARKGTPVVSATSGLVIFIGNLSLGGKVVTVLSPDFKFFYYAHLDTISVGKFQYLTAGDNIGTVGNTGNAKFTPPHLHFSISRFAPRQIYFDPVPLLNNYFLKNE